MALANKHFFYPIDKNWNYSGGQLKEVFLVALLASSLWTRIFLIVYFKLALTQRFKSFLLRNVIGCVCLILCVYETERGYNECLVMLENSNNV
jgi:hypothetical protein